MLASGEIERRITGGQTRGNVRDAARDEDLIEENQQAQRGHQRQRRQLDMRAQATGRDEHREA